VRPAVRRRRRRSLAAQAATGAALLGGSWWALRSPAFQRADVRVGDAVRRAGSAVADRAVAGTTDLGSLYGVAGTSAVLLASGRRAAAADVAAIGGAAWALAQTNKRFVRRARPYEDDGVRRLVRPPTGSSFPSGHSAVGMAVMAVLADRAYGVRSAWALRLLGAYVGLSRVYVGVHYPSDVLGGAGLGLLLSAAWRGPVALAGRSVVGTSYTTALRYAPDALRAAVLLALAVRMRRQGVGAASGPSEPVT
jgi:undecaprenyl-diphosphatase